jgi:hypothetical protein
LINSGYPWKGRHHVPEGSTVVELGCAVRYPLPDGWLRSFIFLVKKLHTVYEARLQTDASICLPLPYNSVCAVISHFSGNTFP